MPAEDESDAELIVRSARGERAAFETVVSRHGRAVYRLARAITHDADDADDVLQETFLSAYRTCGNFRAQSSVRRWLLTITRNAALRLQSRGARNATVDLDADVGDTALGVDAGWGSDPANIVIRSQRSEALRDALESLPPHEREILVLRDLERFPCDEVAEMLALSRAATKSRLHRARLHLLARLRGAHVEL